MVRTWVGVRMAGVGAWLATVAWTGGAAAQADAWPPRIDAPARPPPTEPPRTEPDGDAAAWETPPAHDEGAPADDGRRWLVFDVFALAAFADSIGVSDEGLQRDLELPLHYTLGFGIRPRFFPWDAVGIGPYVRVMGHQTWGVAGLTRDGDPYRLGQGTWWTVDVGPSVVAQVPTGPVWLFVNVEGGATLAVVDRHMDGFESDSELGWNVAGSAGVRWWPDPKWSLFAEVGVAHHVAEHRPPDYDIFVFGPAQVTPRLESTVATVTIGVGFGN